MSPSSLPPSLPPVLSPMLATAGAPPAPPGWAYEWKWDGMRALVAIAGGQLRITSRDGRVLTSAFPDLDPLAHQRKALLLDGEIVACDEHGAPSFARLQARLGNHAPDDGLQSRVPVRLFAFDLLQHGADELLDEPYEERRRRLLALTWAEQAPVQTHTARTDLAPQVLLEVAAEHGLEGIVAKRRDSPYRPGTRSGYWIKTPLRHSQEVVIGGWSPSTASGLSADAPASLLIGVHDQQGLLRYAGAVGSGFTQRAMADLATRMAPLERESSPFADPLPPARARAAHWVEPTLVGEVAYRAWTGDGRLRQASWRGLRPDKNPADARREEP